MLTEKSTPQDRKDLIPLIDKLEASRNLVALDELTKVAYAVTKVGLLGDRVIFYFKGDQDGQEIEDEKPT